MFRSRFRTLCDRVFPQKKSALVQLRELQRENDEKRIMFKMLVDSVSGPVFIKDSRFVYVGCNRVFEEVTGKSEGEIIGSTDFDIFGMETATQRRDTDAAIMQSDKPKKIEWIKRGETDEETCFETMIMPCRGADGNFLGIIGVGWDVSARKQKEEKLLYLSNYDEASGIYNRSYFLGECARLDRAEYLPLSVIIGDINGMKLVNDAFGPRAGDELIRDIARVLKACSRKNDVVARIGGDEFAVLLPNTDDKTARSIIASIRDTCGGMCTEKNMFRTVLALGYATKKNEEDSFDGMMTLAEDFMYRRKLLEGQSLRSSVLASIKTTMFEKSNETVEHAERLVELSKKLGDAVGLPGEKLDELELAAMLHDIGKISVDQGILTKPGKLTDDEWREIKKHPEVGYRIANSCPELSHIAYYILCHHERWDGFGYPQNLTGEEIPLISCIIAITDSYDAITQDRAYRKAMTRKDAVLEIMRNAGTQFDPVLAKIFVEQIIGDQPQDACLA